VHPHKDIVLAFWIAHEERQVGEVVYLVLVSPEPELAKGRRQSSLHGARHEGLVEVAVHPGKPLEHRPVGHFGLRVVHAVTQRYRPDHPFSTPSSRTALWAARNPTFECVPSQKGLAVEPPQRHGRPLGSELVTLGVEERDRSLHQVRSVVECGDLRLFSHGCSPCSLVSSARSLSCSPQ
jgi:hypothetical protein